MMRLVNHIGRSRDIYGAGVGGGLAQDTSPCPSAMNRAATPIRMPYYFVKSHHRGRSLGDCVPR